MNHRRISIALFTTLLSAIILVLIIGVLEAATPHQVESTDIGFRLPDLNPLPGYAIRDDAAARVDKSGKLAAQAGVDATDVVTADLSISKYDDPDPVPPKSTLTYTLVIYNAGPSVAGSVVATDKLGRKIDFIDGSTSQGTTCTGTTTITCPLGNINPQTTATVTLHVYVNPGTNTRSNTATVTSTTTDPVPGNNSVTIATTVASIADLSIIKTESADPVAAGETLTYTLNVSNTGPSDAADVTVTDVLPAGVTYLSSPGVTCTGTTTRTCGLGDLGAGASASFDIVVGVNPAALATLQNSATVTSSAIDLDLTDNSTAITTAVVKEADLSITKNDSPDPAAPGGPLTYTLTIQNKGPSVASTVVVTDVLPAGVSFVSATPSQGSCTPGATVSCSLGTLNPNATGTVTIRTNVAQGQVSNLSNTATVKSSTTDPAPSNNSVTAATEINPIADLSITKTAQPTPAVAGTRITYTLNVVNQGPAVASGVVVTDDLPNTGLSSIAAAASQGTCSQVDPVACTLGSLNASATATVTVTALVNSDRTQPLANTATVGSGAVDDNQSNNTDAVTTNVIARADLAVTKSDDPDPAVAGETLTYGVAIFNAGPSTAPGVVLTDTLSGDVTVVSKTSSQGTCSQSNASSPVNCSLSTLAVGATSIVTITVNVDAAAPNTIANTVTVSSNLQDNNLANNSDSEVTSVNRPGDLGLTVIDSVDPVVAGEILTYTLTVVNSSLLTATDVILTDTLPSQVDFLSAVTTAGSCTEDLGDVVCTLPNLGINDEAEVKIGVLVDPSTLGVINNTVKVTGEGLDATIVNQNTLVVAEADLSITKQGSPSTVAAGEALTYTLTVTNKGPSDAVAVVANDALPSGVTFQSSSICTLEGTILTCDFGGVKAGASEKATFVVMVNSNTSGSMQNSAFVASDTKDPVRGNNTDVTNTTIVKRADLAITKAEMAGQSKAGQNVIFTVVVTNKGPSTASDVTLVDDLPPELTLVSATPDRGSCIAADPVSCGLGTMQPGAEATVVIVATIDPAVKGTINNTITVSSSTPDPKSANNKVTFSIAPENHLLYLSLVTSSGDIAEPNDSCETAYTIPVNANLSFWPDDLNDWYQFTLPGPGDLLITLSEFAPQRGQLTLFYGTSCSDRPLVAINGDTATEKILDLPSRPAGHYYLYISNDNSFSTAPYSLRLDFTP